QCARPRRGEAAVGGPPAAVFPVTAHLADGAYGGDLIAWVWALRPRRKVCLEIVRRPKGVKGFQLLPWRWIVERTFGWLGRYRRLSKDYEYLTQPSEAMIRVAMIHLMVRCLARLTSF